MSLISEASRKEMASGAGTKDDFAKTRLSLIPPMPLELLGKVLTFGAKKYNDENWMNGMSWRRVYDAALRHMNAWLSGEDNDPETGLPHLSHAMCCLVFLVQYGETHKDWDDRADWSARKKPAAAPSWLPVEIDLGPRTGR